MVLHACGYKIALDRHEIESDLNFVSHAHSDHISGLRKNKSAIMSTATRALLEARGKKAETIALPKGMEMLNSGHIFGSKQLYIESDVSGKSIIYSGDYQMQKSYAAEEIETRRADVLIIDSTYPYPGIEFDDKEEVTSAIQCYSKSKLERGTVLFGAYSMGKAQELIKILNLAGMAPLVDEKIVKINHVYESFGMKLDYGCIEEQVENKGSGNFIGIVNVSKLKEWKSGIEKMQQRRVYTAVATGFAKVFTFDTDVQFALSDHADFKQAVEYISLCSPKEIYTVGSQADKFAKNLLQVGYKASPFSQQIPITAPITSTTAELL